jgi:MFS superfamily sulfate permease-like transporter
MPGGGGTTQTAVNVLAGARTQVAEIVTAVMALLTILFLSPFIGLTPQSALVAIVIVFYCALRLHQWFVERTRPVARFLFLD